MKIEIVTKNYHVNNELREVLDKKIAKLDKYFDDQAKCKVYLKKEKKDSKMELSLDYLGQAVRAEAKAENFYDAIDKILPKVERQIYKHRSKLEAKLKKTAFKGDLVYEEPVETEEFKLVKTKRFDVYPMTVDEAIVEFELSGYGFFVFLDADSNTVKVLYLRDDGNIGLIDPVVR
ncbi:MAG: ribosome-associated translation inhibitor RaiA [Clostridia bacterium]|nr:ribosome-associated translation inhibitor RaiA [Clostridia bacterium]